MTRKILRPFILWGIEKILDPVILWCWEWEKRKIVEEKVHYRDPQTGDLWLRDKAIDICEGRLRRERQFSNPKKEGWRD